MGIRSKIQADLKKLSDFEKKLRSLTKDLDINVESVTKQIRKTRTQVEKKVQTLLESEAKKLNKRVNTFLNKVLSTTQSKKKKKTQTRKKRTAPKTTETTH